MKIELFIRHSACYAWHISGANSKREIWFAMEVCWLSSTVLSVAYWSKSGPNQVPVSRIRYENHFKSPRVNL